MALARGLFEPAAGLVAVDRDEPSGGVEIAERGPEALKKELVAGKGDGEILEWIEKNAKNKRTDAEIATWSEFAERRVPTDAESRDYFSELQKKSAPTREDIATWFDLLDVDDYVSFGGKA